jgi:hypothetical protein
MKAQKGCTKHFTNQKATPLMELASEIQRMGDAIGA